MRIIRFVLLIALLLLNIYGCATSTSPATYTRGQAQRAYSVFDGTVVSVKPVLIEGTRSGLGAIIGTVAGGVLGSTIGGGKGQTVATVGGALGGAAAGAAVEEGLTKEQGLEIVVKLDNGETLAVAQGADVQFAAGERIRLYRYPDGHARVTKY